MPIEIRELIIKATINDTSIANLAGATVSLTLSPGEKEALINAVAQKVLELLDRKTEETQIGFLPASFEIPAAKRTPGF